MLSNNCPNFAFFKRKKDNEKIVFIAMSKIFCSAKHKNLDKKDKIFLSNTTLFENEISQKINKFSKIYPNWRGVWLCKDCLNLALLAQIHIQQCARIQDKSFCHLCPKNCYSKRHLKQISTMMKFSGKRILFYHPLLALKYIFFIVKSKRLTRCKSEI